MNCSEPDFWKGHRSGPDADDEEIARYLEHVQTCPFHAALEQQENAVLRQAADVTRHVSSDQLDSHLAPALQDLRGAVTAIILRADEEILARIGPGRSPTRTVDLSSRRTLEVAAVHESGGAAVPVRIFALKGIQSRTVTEIQVSEIVAARLAFDSGPPLTLSVTVAFHKRPSRPQTWLAQMVNALSRKQLAAIAACALVAVAIVPLVFRVWHLVRGDVAIEEPYRSATSLALIKPDPDATIDTYQEFRWQPLASAKEYVIAFVDPETAKTILRRTTRDASFLLTREDHSVFTAGHLYRWFVEANVAGQHLQSESRVFQIRPLQGRSEYRRFSADIRQKWEDQRGASRIRLVANPDRRSHRHGARRIRP